MAGASGGEKEAGIAAAGSAFANASTPASVARASVAGGGLCLRIGRDGGGSDAKGQAAEACDGK